MLPESNPVQATANGQSKAPVASLAQTAGRALTGASREFHDVLSDIEELIKATTSLTGDDLARAKNKLNLRVAEAKRSLETIAGGVADKARETVDRTNVYVHDQPWQAIGIGAGLGLLAGLLLARRG